jgi:16S rRNA (cytosine1402-N4)-methyltransferase
MLEEVLAHLLPAPGKVVVDLTLGGGGYSAACLERGARVIGLDLDPEAIAGASERLSSHGDRFTARQTAYDAFGAILDELGLHAADGIVMDLGLSSDQLDDPGRGFGFRHEGPFDLRFDRTRGLPAWRRLAEADPGTLRRWLAELGEVRAAGRVARALHRAAAQGRARTTAEIRAVVEGVLPAGRSPAGELARVFQAFRILVNDELGALERALGQVCERLQPTGRFVAVSYHSLEDRRVKSLLRREGRPPATSRHLPAPDFRPRLRILTPRPLRPDPAEVETNPRARSARLRAAERLA